MAWSDFLLPPLDWQAFTPELVVLLFALLAPIVALWDTDRKGMQQFTLFGLGGAFLMSLGSLLGWNFGIPGTGIHFTLEYIGRSPNAAFVVTEASQFLKPIFTGVAFLAVLGAGKVLPRRADEDHGEFHSLVLFATLGMMIVASAQELITLLLGIEIASMSSYLLAGIRRDRAGAEAAVKYFTIGAVSSGMTLFGISLVYGITGTTHIPTIGTMLEVGGQYDAVTLVTILMLLAALAFKISSVPFHVWAPDVYQGAPSPVAGMLAAGSKAMGFAALFNVFLVGLIGVAADWQLTLAAVAVVTMFLGNLVALRQDSLRRMLAYSSVAQAGYLLIAVVAAGAAAQAGTLATQGWYAVTGGLLHLLVNAGMKLGAFLIVGALILVGVKDHIGNYKGLGRRAPLFAFAMTVFLLSMAGLPPLGGFTSKFVLFSSAVDVGVTQSLGWLLWLAVFAVLNSAISLFYYVRVIRTMYVEDAPGDKLHIDSGARMAVIACMVFVLLVGIYPSWFLDAARGAAASMLGFTP